MIYTIKVVKQQLKSKIYGSFIICELIFQKLPLNFQL